MACGASLVRRFISVPLFSTGETAKISTVMKPDLRKSTVAFICASSRLTWATAVLAAGKRCEWTIPSGLPGSREAPSGKGQSAHTWLFGGEENGGGACPETPLACQLS